GQYGVDIAIAQAGLVKTHVRAEIFRIQYVFIGMVKLAPQPIATDHFLVLLAQCLSVQSVACGKSGYADGSAFNLPLLKKRRTRR
uniref:hypothetical protein n=1 Tax=Bacteroides acidifaciens TaxID=85831 RepID=UPI0025B20726